MVTSDLEVGGMCDCHENVVQPSQREVLVGKWSRGVVLELKVGTKEWGFWDMSV